MKILIILILLTQSIFPNANAGNDANYESRFIVDMPTAGVIPKGKFSVYSNFYTRGGLLLDLTASIFNNFNMSLSYSMLNAIGSGEPSGPDYPGVSLKYRIIQEKQYFPALTLGISTQGRGEWNNSEKRFQTLSPGVYLASSKAFNWFLGNFALHLGVNYSFEPKPDDRNPNVYFGYEQSIGDDLAFILELNGTFDDGNQIFNKENGLGNIGLRWGLSQSLALELQIRDIFNTQLQYGQFTRYLTLEYIASY